MKRFLSLVQFILTIFFTFSGLLNASTVKSENQPSVIINELMWMGSSVSSSDEWLELKNLTNQTIDLSNWYLTKKSGGGEVIMLTLPVRSIIEANGFFLISNYSNESPSSVLNVAPDVVDTSVSLVNSSLQIKLYNSEQLLIDTADDGSGQPLTGSYESGSIWKSMERNWDYADGTLETSWHTADISYNFDPGAVEFGTPRWPNTDPNYPPIAEAGDDQTVKVNETVYFDGSDSTDPEGDFLTFHWIFGDTAESTVAAPTHCYTQAGVYETILTVSDGLNEASDTTTITVEEPEPNEEPINNPPSDEPDSQIKYPKDIRINEILPNPEGSDSEHEYIELMNIGLADIDLINWKVSDSSREYKIKSDDFTTTVIEAGGYFVIYRPVSKIALNNSSPETVKLYQPDNNQLEEASYEPPVSEAQSYNLTDSGWVWSTTQTPGQDNQITHSEEPTGNEEEAPENEQTSSEPDENPNTQFDYSELILITELLPNPEGPDTEEEFIEIANFDSREINLLGWTLTDTKTYFEIKEPQTIAPGEYQSFNRPDTKISLNNSSEQIFLIDPNEKIISGVNYEKSPEGQSWSRIEQTNNWTWTTVITPERTNAIELEAEIESDNEETTGKTSEVRKVELSEIRSLPQRQAIKTSGCVMVVPDVLGKQIIYIGNENSGIQVYSSTSSFPDLEMGNLIEITGTVGESQGERKINIKTADDITVAGQSEIPKPLLISGSTLSEEHEGRLVQIEGDVISKNGQTLVLDSSGEEVTVYIKKTTSLKMADYKEGNGLIIIGLVSQTKSGYRILPRSPEDITKSEVLGVSTESDESTEEVISLETDNSRNRTLIYLFLALGILIIAGGIYYWKNRRK